MTTASNTSARVNNDREKGIRSISRFGARLAWRDFAASQAKFILFIVAIASAVAAVTAISDLGDTVHASLIRNARQWLAADIQVRLNRLPDPEQERAIAVESRWTTTIATETAAHIALTDGSHFEIAAIKAVDPRVYPAYGEILLRNRVTLKQVLDDNSAVVSADVLAKLKVRVGDTIRIGGAEFQIKGVIETEPDRFAVMPLALLRVIISRDGLARTGMIERGASAIQRLLIRVPSDDDIDRATQRASELFPRAEVADYRENAASVAGIEEQAASYFQFLSFVGLTVAALGVGLLMYTHVRQRMDTVAIVKLLGGTSSQVMRVYAMQMIWMAMAGSLLGIAGGAFTERAFSKVAGSYLPLPLAFHIPWKAGMEGIGLGVVVPLLFSLAPLAGVREIRPALLLRRHVDMSARPRAALGIAALAFAAIASAVALLINGIEPLVAAYLLLAVAGGALAVWGASIIAKRILKALLRSAKFAVPSTIRYGAANLMRPGSMAILVAMVLGLGVCFVYLSYLIEGSLVRQLLQYSPFQGANLYLLNVAPQLGDAVLDQLHRDTGVSRVDLDPFVVLHLIAINGVPVNSKSHSPVRRAWFAALSSTQPKSVKVVEGRWWRADDPASNIALSVRAASAMGVKIGDIVEFANGPELVRVRVTEIHRGSGPESLRFPLVLNPNTVSDVRVTFNGGAWIAASARDRVESALRTRFPTVIILNQAEVATIMQDTAAQVAALLRLFSIFSLAGGAMILSASILALRFERELEISVLKTLGATRRRIVEALGTEFTLLGLFAGVLGIALGNLLGAALGAYAFSEPLETFWSWRSALATVAITIVLTNLAGWGAGIAMLKRKPSEILRGE